MARREFHWANVKCRHYYFLETWILKNSQLVLCTLSIQLCSILNCVFLVFPPTWSTMFTLSARVGSSSDPVWQRPSSKYSKCSKFKKNISALIKLNINCCHGKKTIEIEIRKTADKSKNKNNLGRQENAASATVYVQHPQLGSARGKKAIRQLGNWATRQLDN